jgi:sigma-B regulation protein RsbU (phosphoserine phosphatase)
MTSSFTMDFREEFEAERTRWLRRRVAWYCAVMMGVIALMLAIMIVARLPNAGAEGAYSMRVFWLQVFNALPELAVFAAALSWVRRHAASRERLLRIVFIVIVAVGLTDVVFTTLIVRLATPAEESLAIVRAGVGVGSLGMVFMLHGFATLFIPWTPREAVRPLVPLLIAVAIVTLLFSEASMGQRVLVIVLSPLVGVPGVAVAWWRHSRFRTRFHFMKLRGEYGTMKRELTDARRIHDVLFPPAITDGPVRFDFRYEPMRQIGGDYLYTCVDDSRDGCPPRLTVVIIDVTGHGISAALTVNRIHGELERLFGEKIDLSPGETVTALNHYINVALAKHSVYATAICLRVDPAEEVVQWCSAGHPPAFVLTAGGLIDRLEPTAIMLGAARDDEFDPDARSMAFRQGDVVIAYTDGVTESRNQDGRMLGIEGLQAVMAALPPGRAAAGDYTEAVLRAVREHRFGATADDTLIVGVCRAKRG